jgi:hypothetical protein
MTSMPWITLPQFVKYHYILECGQSTYKFETYRDAEIFCGERGISCEDIYEYGAD